MQFAALALRLRSINAEKRAVQKSALSYSKPAYKARYPTVSNIAYSQRLLAQARKLAEVRHGEAGADKGVPVLPLAVVRALDADGL